MYGRAGLSLVKTNAGVPSPTISVSQAVKVRAKAKGLLALGVEREKVFYPLLIVPADVPKDVPRPRGRRGRSVPRPPVIANVDPIREPVLVPDRGFALHDGAWHRCPGLPPTTASIAASSSWPGLDLHPRHLDRQ